MITANTRVRLTVDDFDFIITVLSVKESDRVTLENLLTDESLRNEILDHELLAKASLESPDRLLISPQLMFYVLCRHVLRHTGASSREVADFVASLLDTFTRTTRIYQAAQGLYTAYLSDMMQALSRASGHEAFLLRSHMANYSLFVSGMFVENLERRQERGAPDVTFYESVGGTNYLVAADCRDAQRYCLSSIYEELARSFHEVRIALNDLATRLLHVDSPSIPILTGLN